MKKLLSRKLGHLPEFTRFKEIIQHVCKGDIPEVSAVLAIIQPLVLRHWRRVIEDAIEHVESELRDLTDELPTPDVDFIAAQDTPEKRKRKIEDFVISLMGGLRRRIRAPFSGADQAVVRDAVRSLLRDGAASLGFEFNAGAPNAGELPQAAAEDLAFAVRARLQDHEDDVRALLVLFLTAATVRKASASSAGDAAIRTVDGVVNDLESWQAALREALGQQAESWLPQIVDVWGYRWFNIGSFVSDVAEPETGLFAQATLDHKTSPFCRWVDGRLISRDKAERQIRDYIVAVRSDDLQAAKLAWPLITVRPSDTVRDFVIATADGIGLPPYHWRCRTVPVRRRLNVAA